MVRLMLDTCRPGRLNVLTTLEDPLMKLSTFVLCLAVLTACATTARVTAQSDGASLAYPKARTVDQVDDYHGLKVADPYRWLEDADSADTKAWVEEENKLTFRYLKRFRTGARSGTDC
jgi:hypothetical protein